MHADEEQRLLQGSSHLPVHGLLLLQSVPDASEGHDHHDHPEEHHLRGNVLRRQAELPGATDAVNLGRR